VAKWLKTDERHRRLCDVIESQLTKILDAIRRALPLLAAF
jgi:hypothetical protein